MEISGTTGDATSAIKLNVMHYTSSSSFCPKSNKTLNYTTQVVRVIVYTEHLVRIQIPDYNRD